MAAASRRSASSVLPGSSGMCPPQRAAASASWVTRRPCPAARREEIFRWITRASSSRIPDAMPRPSTQRGHRPGPETTGNTARTVTLSDNQPEAHRAPLGDNHRELDMPLQDVLLEHQTEIPVVEKSRASRRAAPLLDSTRRRTRSECGPFPRPALGSRHLSQVRSEHVLVNSSLLCLESIRCPAIRVANRFTGLQAEEGTARSVLLSTGRAVLPPGDDKITSPCMHPASPTVRLRRDRCAEHARVAATRVAIRCDRIGLHACRAALLIPRTAAGTAGVTEAT